MALFDPHVRFYWEGAWTPGTVEPWRRLYDCELVYVASGRFEFHSDDGVEAMGPGSFAVIPPAFRHESRALASGALRHCVHFDWVPGAATEPVPLFVFSGEPFDEKRVHPVPPAIADRLPLVAHAPGTARLVPIMDLALGRFREKDPLAEALLWPILKGLLDLQSPSTGVSAACGKTARAVSALKHFIDTHYAEALGYDQFRGVTRLSASHLCQAFTRWIGRSPTAYLNDIRLHHARRLLQETAQSVKEVARAVGISDANYFARLFRRKFGMPPTRLMRP
jgi:AraC-like DNA-binding protein